MDSNSQKALLLAAVWLTALLGTLLGLVNDDTGRLDPTALLVYGCILGIPSLFFVAVLFWAAWMSVVSGQTYFASTPNRVSSAPAGQCEHCRTPFSGQDEHCPGCGRSLSGRWILAEMMAPAPGRASSSAPNGAGLRWPRPAEPPGHGRGAVRG